ncbi:chromosome segregation ATPase [Cytobacillus eiseniae]|uniref:Chromosome segregation ATPase n=1 Tax=Cytobacillus eiseniae TaxID=762947 RepID=A0ABS4R9S9_9BACI|nr:hypothetical protein [Cytobacillus eiseniae]MBP2239645.1 chromosome segregation ATPase [Cytobacillus eiseniae]
MNQSGIQEILKALELHSKHIDHKITDMKVQLENRMDEKFARVDQRFEKMDQRLEQMEEKFDQMDERVCRIETKLDSLKVEIIETQQDVDHLTIKNVQHERKLRKLIKQV